MRFYTHQHQFYCGIDLHARSIYVCIMDQTGAICVHKNLPAQPDTLLPALAAYREDLVVAVECIFTWYWIADLCEQEGIAFVLGHALYLKAIHGGKTKNHKIDSQKIAYRSNRLGITETFADPMVQKSIEVDVQLLDTYGRLIREVELQILRRAREHDPITLHLLRTIPGVGKVLAMIILYEIHDIGRFAHVDNYISYCRLVKCQQESAGKKSASRNNKIGNVHLKWAFSEAACLFLRDNEDGQRYQQKLASRYGKSKALSIIAQKLARSVYAMLTRKQPFDSRRFFDGR